MTQSCTSVGGKPAMLSIYMDGQVVRLPPPPTPQCLSQPAPLTTPMQPSRAHVSLPLTCGRAGVRGWISCAVLVGGAERTMLGTTALRALVGRVRASLSSVVTLHHHPRRVD